MEFSMTEQFGFQNQNLLELLVGTLKPNNSNFEYLVKKEEHNISNEIDRCSSLESVLSKNQAEEQIVSGKFSMENKVII